MSTSVADIYSVLEQKAEKLYDQWELKLTEFCKFLVRSAVKARFTSPGAHNYTGNLINSIIVCLFRRGTLIGVFEAGLPQPVREKMTAPNTYFFLVDWDGQESEYEPEVRTDRGYGNADAYEFSMRYKSSKDTLFEIVLAYPVEYASWVEQQRGTTGYAEMWGLVRTIDYNMVVGTGGNESVF